MPEKKTRKMEPDSKASIVPADTALQTETLETRMPEQSTLYRQVCEILEGARSRAARTVNTEMVRAYWQIGQAIVEQEQAGKERADYGTRLIEDLAARLKADGAKGFSKNNLWYMRQFYLAFPEKLHAPRGELSWTHYRLLLKVEKPPAREWYEAEAATQNWSTRELERQINSLFWERAALSNGKQTMLEKVRDAAEEYSPADFVKDPYVLEFLGLKEIPDRQADASGPGPDAALHQLLHARNVREMGKSGHWYSALRR